MGKIFTPSTPDPYSQGVAAGQTKQSASADQKAAETESAIATSEANSPKDLSGAIAKAKEMDW